MASSKTIQKTTVLESVFICVYFSRLVPAVDTEFAKDAVFGYKASNLREVMDVTTLQDSSPF
jgi:hypothetical protein